MSTDWAWRADRAARRLAGDEDTQTLLDRPYAGSWIRVMRSKDHLQIDVPEKRLHAWHIATHTAGGRFRVERPHLAAYMLCIDIPEGQREEFGHFCSHGPPPHIIRVLIVPRGLRLRLSSALLGASRLARLSLQQFPMKRCRQAARRHALPSETA